jgi:hypothetical protein
MFRALSSALLHFHWISNTLVWLILRRHTTEMEDTTFFLDLEKDKIWQFFLKIITLFYKQFV